jgi:hypothetical protein
MKLRTLEFCIITLTEDDLILLADGSRAHAGAAFITRYEDGIPWGGSKEELDFLINPADIGRLIVFDTWTRNCDRYMPRQDNPRVNRDNVYLSTQEAPKGRFLLKAIDHGCCFTCGRELTSKMSGLDLVQENRLYGRFPQFADRTNRIGMLQIVQEVEAITREDVEQILQQVPRGWDLSSAATGALCDFVCNRARYIREIIDNEWPPRDLFDLGMGQEPQP